MSEEEYKNKKMEDLWNVETELFVKNRNINGIIQTNFRKRGDKNDKIL